MLDAATYSERLEEELAVWQRPVDASDRTRHGARRAL